MVIHLAADHILHSEHCAERLACRLRVLSSVLHDEIRDNELIAPGYRPAPGNSSLFLPAGAFIRITWRHCEHRAFQRCRYYEVPPQR